MQLLELPDTCKTNDKSKENVLSIEVTAGEITEEPTESRDVTEDTEVNFISKENVQYYQGTE